MPPHIRSSWSSVRLELQGLAIRRSGSKDVLAWYLPRAPSPVRVKDLYAALSLGPEISNQQIFPFSLWKVTCPLKTILFSWLLFRNRNLTWEVLQKKGWQGPGRCSLCQNAEESNFHMFFQCPVSQQIWYELSPWISPTMVFPLYRKVFFGGVIRQLLGALCLSWSAGPFGSGGMNSSSIAPGGQYLLFFSASRLTLILWADRASHISLALLFGTFLIIHTYY